MNSDFVQQLMCFSIILPLSHSARCSSFHFSISFNIFYRLQRLEYRIVLKSLKFCSLNSSALVISFNRKHNIMIKSWNPLENEDEISFNWDPRFLWSIHVKQIILHPSFWTKIRTSVSVQIFLCPVTRLKTVRGTITYTGPTGPDLTQKLLGQTKPSGFKCNCRRF